MDEISTLLFEIIWKNWLVNQNQYPVYHLVVDSFNFGDDYTKESHDMNQQRFEIVFIRDKSQMDVPSIS